MQGPFPISSHRCSHEQIPSSSGRVTRTIPVFSVFQTATLTTFPALQSLNNCVSLLCLVPPRLELLEGRNQICLFTMLLPVGGTQKIPMQTKYESVRSPSCSLISVRPAVLTVLCRARTFYQLPSSHHLGATDPPTDSAALTLIPLYTQLGWCRG